MATQCCDFINKAFIVPTNPRSICVNSVTTHDLGKNSRARFTGAIPFGLPIHDLGECGMKEMIDVPSFIFTHRPCRWYIINRLDIYIRKKAVFVNRPWITKGCGFHFT